MDANYTNRIDSQFYKMIYSLIIIILMMINYTSAQYYQPLNPYSYDTNSQLQSSQYDSIEQKYVNSGQSIVLICDLPNSMPDGKVCLENFFLVYIYPSVESSRKHLRPLIIEIGDLGLEIIDLFLKINRD